MRRKINCKDFAEQYYSSGLSRSDFGGQQGMSTSMVSYYLKKATKLEQQACESSTFLDLEIKSMPSLRHIKIITPSGLTIELPF